MTFEIGAGTGVLVDGRDITAKSNTLQVSDDIAAVEDTVFHRSLRARRYISGLRGGAITAAGYLPVEVPLVTAEMQAVLGTKRDEHLIATAPFGFGTTPGNLAIFAKSLQNNWGVDGQSDGCVAMTASFEADDGIKDGVVLHSPHASAAAVAEVQTIAVTNADAPDPLTIADASGNEVEVAEGASAAVMQAALETLLGIGAGNVTVGLVSGAGVDTYTCTFSSELGNVGQLVCGDAGVVMATTTQGQAENLSIITATANGTTVDNAAATSKGWTAQLNVIHAGGTTPTLDVVIEHSTDDSNWTTLATFAQVTTATGAQSLTSAAVTTTVNRYVRAKRTISGTNPKYAYSVCLSRRK
jgi:hypothetical protein